MPRRNGDDTKARLADAFMQLMETTPIDKITVKGLVELCGVNRQTFYYHFHDILELVKWIYLHDLKRALRESSRCTSWEEGLRCLLAEVDKDRVFHTSIYASSSYYPRLRQEFLAILTERLVPTFKPMFDKLNYDDEYCAFLVRMYSLVLYEFIEKRAQDIAFSSVDGFISNWLRSLNEQFQGALRS